MSSLKKSVKKASVGKQGSASDSVSHFSSSSGAVVRAAAQSNNAVSAPLPQRASADSNALLIIGTYHSVMLGLILRNHKFLLKFSVKHHDGCVNAVAACGKYVATCGYDERVFLFTNKMTPKKQQLLQPSGSASAAYRVVNNPQLADLGTLTPPSEVTCMRWAAGSSFLLCGCGDGSLIAYRARDWSVALSLTVHEKGINDIAIHPGKRSASGTKSGGDGGGGTLAVTIGADRFVAVLDLVSGKLLTKWRIKLSNPNKRMRNSEYQRLKEKQAENGEEEGKETESSTTAAPAPLVLSAMFMDEPSHVRFSPSGDYFVVLTRFMLFVYRTSTMALMTHYEMKRRRPEDELHCLAFHHDTSVFIGNESGDVIYFDFSEKQEEKTKQKSGKGSSGETDTTGKKRKRQDAEPVEDDGKDGDAESDVATGVVTVLRRNVPRAVIESQRSSGRRTQDGSQSETNNTSNNKSDDAEEDDKRMTRLKYPYKHVARIKTISYSCSNAIHTASSASVSQGSGAGSVEGGEAHILFTVDTHGIVIAWNVSTIESSQSASVPETHDSGLEYNSTLALQYIASANCQGRATSMEVMML